MIPSGRDSGSSSAATSMISSCSIMWSVTQTPNRALAALCLFVTSVVGAALGALMALSASPWYAAYAAMTMMPFGLTPEQDQQLAGLIMWVPGGMVHAGAALVLVHAMLRRDRDAAPALERVDA